ncbi:DUF1731 domain-containing protein, partial [Paraburkholderia aspalathi]|nr:DUF1731 domain-containing protein [Paraburkholderia aspalathi]
IAPILFDESAPSEELLGALHQATHLVISISPGADGDPALRLVKQMLSSGQSSLQWIAYLSTVGVYGDHQGDLVDEDTLCQPTSRRSIERVQAERDWQTLAEQYNVPLAILRLSGIYGPGRNALINLQRGSAKRIIKRGQVFNRIHVDDIAGALAFLSQNNTGGIFNITDDEPAPPQDVVAYAADLLGVSAPPEIAFETADMTPMARSFYSENKRVSNKRIKNLGFAFRYPDYRSAFQAMWRDDNWR